MIDDISNIQPANCSTGGCGPGTGIPEPESSSGGSRFADTVQISKAGLDKLKGLMSPAPGSPGGEALDPQQEQEVRELKQTDQEVKAHERAHMAAGAGLVMGGANYQYQRGPDGKMYAVGGEVKIDTSREKDPQDTIRKMQRVKRAALAPSQPSGQDRSVAARASQIEAEARIELLKEKTQENQTNSSTDERSASPESTGTKKPYQSSAYTPTLKTAA